jgi:IS30 family transposase
MSVYSQAEFDAVADELNNRPRQTLGWLKTNRSFQQVPGLGCLTMPCGRA